jgi:hypothetical protein
MSMKMTGIAREEIEAVWEKAEDRGQRSEDRGQRAEIRGRKSEIRGQSCNIVSMGASFETIQLKADYYLLTSVF